MVVIIKFQKDHFMLAVGTFQRVIAKGRKDGIAPQVEVSVNTMPVFGNSPVK